jgi:hypothetical protein
VSMKLPDRIPPTWLAAAAAGIVALLAVGAFLLLRQAGPGPVPATDGIAASQFCFGCHELEGPERQLTHTGHRGMECTACHEPVTVGRQVAVETVDRFGRIVAHAAVPNERCAACHVDGDPEQWRQIGQAAGHRVHLESDDPSLRGLQCVECHGASIHKFTVAQQTCSQSGCHDDIAVRLGRMGDLTIHCVACHEFSRPVPREAAFDPALASLRPQQQGCVGCHAMRELSAGMAPDEPHELACATCHDPHRQERPADAARTCATSGCHARPDTLTTMHLGLAVGVLDNCIGCHAPHDTRVQGNRCLDCHADIYDNGGVRFGGVADAQAQPQTGLLASLRSVFVTSSATAARAAAAQQSSRGPLVFAHRDHRGVDCMQCHSTASTHGAVTVTSVRECRECHHTTVVANRCNDCHRPAEYGGVQQVRQRFDMSVAPARTRLLGFDHASHPNVACAQCHQPSLTRQASVTCTGCHEDHHQPNRSCISCHLRPGDRAHDANAHLGCTAAGCHEPAPFVGVPRTRNFCLSCHQDRVDHEPRGNCAECHALPRPSPQMQPRRTER